MATKDFIYDLVEGLEKNGDDYILVIPENVEDKDGNIAISYDIRYNFNKEDSTAIDSIVGACELLHLEARSVAEENGIDFDEYIEDFLSNDDDDDDDDEEESQPF